MEILLKESVDCYASFEQKEALQKISQIDIICKNFFLTGGTALSVFYLHHRTSEDLDFFSYYFKELNLIDETLRRVFSNDISLLQSSSTFFSYLFNDVKIDFVYEPLTSHGKRNSIQLDLGGTIFIDLLDEIASNKLCTIVSRFEVKDLIDFYFITKNIRKNSKDESFINCYRSAMKKEALFDDPAMAAYQVENLLGYALAKKEQILPPMRRPINWDLLEDNFRHFCNIMYKMQSFR